MSVLPDFGGAASQHIWGLVCGLPPRRLVARKLLMMRAFFDESADDEYFVLAGYISSVPKWAAFSDEWDKLLNHGMTHYPRLDEFHMTEMFSSDARMEMVPWFYRLIEKHVECALSYAVNVRELNEEFDRFNWPSWLLGHEVLRNPYLLGFKFIFQLLHFGRDDLGITEKVDFYFDRRLQDETRCREGWSIMSADPTYRDMCGNGPEFHDSKIDLPLQAADFFAYWVREWKKNGMEPSSGNLPFPWWEAKEDVPTAMCYLGRETIRDNWERWVQRADLQRRAEMGGKADEVPTP